MKNKETIEKIFNNLTHSKNIHEGVLFTENSKGDFSVNCGYGGRNIHSPLFMASVTKLFITSCILILKEQKKLSFEDNIGMYLDKSILDGLHIFKGKDYSYQLKISDLLFQTSGLPDGLDSFIRLAAKNEIEVSFNEVLEKTKTMRPHFAPNTTNRSYYSDMNFRLLVSIIENITGESIANVYQNYICVPLTMTKTYLPTKNDDFIPNIYFKNQSLCPRKFFTSSYNYDAISTAHDLMKFLKA
jgi:CubicO group peptidase (beta-lactamase class C family)